MCALLFVVFAWREKKKERKIKFKEIRSHRLVGKLDKRKRISSVLELRIQVYVKVESNGYSIKKKDKRFHFDESIREAKGFKLHRQIQIEWSLDKVVIQSLAMRSTNLISKNREYFTNDNYKCEYC